MIDFKQKGWRIFLASQSPRRQQLLREMNIPFEVRIKPVEEIYPPDIPIQEVPKFLSRLKAEAFRSELGEKDILITSDTVVLLENEILGKPKNEEDAVEMLTRLTGKTHEVITAVCLTSASKEEIFSDSTKVTFSSLTLAEIESYVKQYQPLDKAGSYGIQEWIGLAGIERIDGSYFNVMGLPTHKLYQALLNFIEP